jgi:hypothetical protein
MGQSFTVYTIMNINERLCFARFDTGTILIQFENDTAVEIRNVGCVGEPATESIESLIRNLNKHTGELVQTLVLERSMKHPTIVNILIPGVWVSSFLNFRSLSLFDPPTYAVKVAHKTKVGF